MTVEQETTLDLDQVMADGMARYPGELDEAARDDAAITPTPDADAGPPQTGHPAETDIVAGDDMPLEESPPQTESGAAEQTSLERGTRNAERGAQDTEGEAPTDDTGDTPTPEPNYRFKSHDEAERGYRHLQAEKTRIEQAKKELEARIQAQEQAAAEATRNQEIEVKIFDYSQQRYQEALKAIDALDPDAEDYKDQVARVWAAKDRDVWRYERSLSVTQAKSTGAPPSPDHAPPAQTGADEPGPQTDAAGVMARVAERAQAAGIDPEDDHFKLVCRNTPTQDASGLPMDLDQQIQYAIDQTLAYQERVAKALQERQRAAATQKAAAEQTRGLPLGRGAAPRPAPSAPAHPVTLDDALQAAMESRRL